jgi:ribosomal protein S18 acetylase RimI-like enzyme
MGTSTPRHAEVVVSDLPPADYETAVGVLARGMRDNPIHVAAYGPDPDRRERCQARLVHALFRTSRGNEPLGVWRDGVLVACTGVLLNGACRPGLAEQLRMLPTMTRLGPRTLGRMAAWLRVWAVHEPKEPHAHLGPLAVDRDLQGQGLGRILLAEHCRRLDEAGLLGYLETDKPENVRFYARAGYRVVAEALALGVPSWFMRREPRARAGA